MMINGRPLIRCESPQLFSRLLSAAFQVPRDLLNLCAKARTPPGAGAARIDLHGSPPFERRATRNRQAPARSARARLALARSTALTLGASFFTAIACCMSTPSSRVPMTTPYLQLHYPYLQARSPRGLFNAGRCCGMTGARRLRRGEFTRPSGRPGTRGGGGGGGAQARPPPNHVAYIDDHMGYMTRGEATMMVQMLAQVLASHDEHITNTHLQEDFTQAFSQIDAQQATDEFQDAYMGGRTRPEPECELRPGENNTKK